MVKNWWNWAKIAYSIPLGVTGAIYLWQPRSTVESLTSFIPGDLNLIYFAGGLWILLSLMLAFNIKTQLAAYGVIALLGAYLVVIHIPAVYTGEYLTIVWFELLRDLSLMGGAFLILAVESYVEEPSHQEVDPHHDWEVSIH